MLSMKRKPVLSLFRCVCGISVLCLLLPCVAGWLRARAFPGPEFLSAGLLAAGAVLLLLPVSDERVSVSLHYSLAALAVCIGGLAAGLPPRTWLAGVLLVHGICMVRRNCDRYEQLQPLFKNMAVWYSVENLARYTYALALYLLVAALPGPGAPPWAGWMQLALSVGLYAVLQVRVRTGRTCFLRPARELEIKDLIKGNLRTPPAQSGRKTEELARMTRLYERVVSLMEQKHPFLDEDFNLDDLAVAVFTNRGYLSRTINVLSGRNFSQFVNYFRVRYGVELMRKDPGLRLISVAQMCGFHSSPSFNAAFKVNMGETPSEFQERLRSERLSR